MRKWTKWLALGISAGILIVAAVMGGSALRRNRQAEPVAAATEQTARPTAKPTAKPTAASTAASTAAPTTEEPTTEAPTAAEPKKPETKAEIVAYFNESANRVKTEKPGYTWQDRVLLDRKGVKTSSRLLNAAAPSILGAVQSFVKFGEWQKQDPVAKGANHDQFPVPGKSWASKLDPGFVKSATCTEAGGEYRIKIVLRDEDVPVLPSDAATLRTGKVMHAWDAGLVEEAKVAEPFITIKNFETNYRDSSVTCTIDKETGRLKSAAYVISCIFVVDVKQFGGTNGSVPFVREEAYTMYN